MPFGPSCRLRRQQHHGSRALPTLRDWSCVKLRARREVPARLRTSARHLGRGGIPQPTGRHCAVGRLRTVPAVLEPQGPVPSRHRTQEPNAVSRPSLYSASRHEPDARPELWPAKLTQNPRHADSPIRTRPDWHRRQLFVEQSCLSHRQLGGSRQIELGPRRGLWSSRPRLQHAGESFPHGPLHWDRLHTAAASGLLRGLHCGWHGGARSNQLHRTPIDSSRSSEGSAPPPVWIWPSTRDPAVD